MHVLVVLALRLTLLPLLVKLLMLLASSFGGPILRPLTWVPGGIYAVLIEILLRSLWHSVMDDD